MKRKKGHYSISVVAKMFGVHQQTIRLYEKEGLITPKRSTGNTRLFSEDDVDLLEEIIFLTHKMGVNLAGVEMVLRLQKKIQKLQKEVNDVFNIANDQLETESKSLKDDARQQAQRLINIKHENQKKSIPSSTTRPIDIVADTPKGHDEWKVEYDDDE